MFYTHLKIVLCYRQTNVSTAVSNIPKKLLGKKVKKKTRKEKQVIHMKRKKALALLMRLLLML